MYIVYIYIVIFVAKKTHPYAGTFLVARPKVSCSGEGEECLINTAKNEARARSA